MLCVRALVRTLNDAKNYAQQGCAMQFNGITLNTWQCIAIFEKCMVSPPPPPRHPPQFSF